MAPSQGIWPYLTPFLLSHGTYLTNKHYHFKLPRVLQLEMDYV